MARRYGQRPSSLINNLDDNRTLFDSEHERLIFDLNVMLVGQATEYKALNDAKSGGKITSRADANRSLARAREMADELEKQNG